MRYTSTCLHSVLGTVFDDFPWMRTCAGAMAWLPIALLACISTASGQDAAPVTLVERARGAERVIVGRVSSVSPMWQVNDFGDRLIVSVLRVAVSETLKGQLQSSVDVEVEGGTLDGVTLRVSDQEPVTAGERAVFYLRRNARGRFVPHLRGQGLLKLDQSDRVPGSSLTLDTIRREVAAAGR